MIGNHKVAVVCGSTRRFKEEMLLIARELELLDYIVFTTHIFNGEYATTEEDAKRCKERYRDIFNDVADVCVVVSEYKYLGESTAADIRMATEAGVPVKYINDISNWLYIFASKGGGSIMRNKTFEISGQKFNILIVIENDSEVSQQLFETMSNKFTRLGYSVNQIKLNNSSMVDNHGKLLELTRTTVIDFIYVINNTFSDGRMPIQTISFLRTLRMLNIPIFFFQYVGDIIEDVIVPPMYLGPGDPNFYDNKLLRYLDNQEGVEENDESGQTNQSGN